MPKKSDFFNAEDPLGLDGLPAKVKTEIMAIANDEFENYTGRDKSRKQTRRIEQLAMEWKRDRKSPVLQLQIGCSIITDSWNATYSDHASNNAASTFSDRVSHSHSQVSDNASTNSTNCPSFSGHASANSAHSQSSTPALAPSVSDVGRLNVELAEAKEKNRCLAVELSETKESLANAKEALLSAKEAHLETKRKLLSTEQQLSESKSETSRLREHLSHLESRLSLQQPPHSFSPHQYYPTHGGYYDGYSGYGPQDEPSNKRRRGNDDGSNHY